MDVKPGNIVCFTRDTEHKSPKVVLYVKIPHWKDWSENPDKPWARLACYSGDITCWGYPADLVVLKDTRSSNRAKQLAFLHDYNVEREKQRNITQLKQMDERSQKYKDAIVSCWNRDHPENPIVPSDYEEQS
jgi:hypothetical protein